MKKPVVYAHRGASGYVLENTIPSFELAIKMKADAVEFDVQLTFDGDVVVFHDFNLNRLFHADKNVSDLKTGEIKQYVFDRTNGKKTAGIPLLEEVLTAIGHKIAMNIELKSESTDPSVLQRLCEKVFGLVQAHGLTQEVVISSFNIDAIRRMRDLSDDIKIAVLVDALSPDTASPASGDAPSLSFYIKTANELHADAINMSSLLVDRTVVSQVHGSGFQLNVYTVNDDELVAWLMDAGADGFFTNYPDRAIAVIEHKMRRGG